MSDVANAKRDNRKKSTYYDNASYQFNSAHNRYRTIRKDDEPDFEISEELKRAVLGDMPEDLLPEEKIMYIYFRMCQIFQYNEEFSYNDEVKDIIFNNEFHKEHLERINPGDKIICYDFSRILAKIVNKYVDDAEAVIIKSINNGAHFNIGIFTRTTSAIYDGININTGTHSNDLTNAKMGLEIEGIKAKSDEYLDLVNAYKKIYPLVFGKEPILMNMYLKSLKAQPKIDSKPDLETEIRIFVETLKNEKISGTEFVQTLVSAIHAGYFSSYLERAYVGRIDSGEDRQHYTRLVLLRKSRVREIGADEFDERPIYAIDTKNMTVVKTNGDKIKELLTLGKEKQNGGIKREGLHGEFR